jgi:hypothetical protein
VRILYLYTLCIGVREANRRKTGLDDAADRGYSVDDDLPVVDIKENQELPKPADEKTYKKTYVFGPDHALEYEKNDSIPLTDTKADEVPSVYTETTVLLSFAGKFTKLIQKYLNFFLQNFLNKFFSLISKI